LIPKYCLHIGDGNAKREGHCFTENRNNSERLSRVFATSHLEVKENLNTRKLRKSGIATLPSAFLPRFIFPRAAIATWPRREVVRFPDVRYLQFSIKLINLPVERLIKFVKLDFSKSCHETRLLFRPYSGSSVINGWRN